MKELMKYPPQFKIGFASNNPPIYDLAPKLEKKQAENANENHNGNGKETKRKQR
jgi:arylsulfatase